MSKLLRGLGNFIVIVGGLLGFILSLVVVYGMGGIESVVLSVFLSPLTFALVPFYVLFVFGSWNLLVLNYGSAAAYWVLHRVADGMDARGQLQPREPAVRERAEIARVKTGKRTIANRPGEKSKGDPGPAIMYWAAGGIVLLGIALSLSDDAAPISTPTRTPFPISTPTHAVKASPAQPPVILNACVTDETIRIRSGPGTEYEVIGGLVSRTCIKVLGRNNDASWVYIETEGNVKGWVAEWLLTMEGNVYRVPVRVSSLAIAATKGAPTATQRPFAFASSTPQTRYNPFLSFCSETADRVGDVVTCKIERAYCEYLPMVNGEPTFCNDRPYPNHGFQVVAWGRDWSDFDGECIIVSGYLELYESKLQIQATSRSQISLCG